MPLVTPSNNFIWGIAKQTNESTVNTSEGYGMPVFSGRSMPVQTTERVQVTDASAMTADPYKQGDEHWEADVEVPAFGAALGRLLSTLWPTDTISGAGPFTHTFSGLGSATSWFTTYNTDLLGGSVEETFEAGLTSNLTFTATEAGGPLRVGVNMVGKRPTVASYTNATPQSIGTDGYFTASGATLKYEVDSTTPATELNVQQLSVVVDAPVTAVPTADSVSVSYLARGKYDCTFTMQLLMDDHEAYRATFYGAVGGSTPSATIVYGSVEFNFVHSITGTHSFKLTIPKAALIAEPPQPNPDASPLIVNINGFAADPPTGDHVQPVLINGVTPAY